MWVPGIATVLALPFAALALLSRDMHTSLLLYILPLTFGYTYLGPSLAMTHALVEPRMRALSSAVLFFILNLIGLGLGPTMVGVISDALEPTYGVDSLRYALMATFVVYLWSAVHYFFAARNIRQELATDALPS